MKVGSKVGDVENQFRITKRKKWNRKEFRRLFRRRQPQRVKVWREASAVPAPPPSVSRSTFCSQTNGGALIMGTSSALTSLILYYISQIKEYFMSLEKNIDPLLH